jgi:hypothetical protein
MLEVSPAHRIVVMMAVAILVTVVIAVLTVMLAVVDLFVLLENIS